MEYPNDLLYTKEHEWIRVEGEEATVGITAYAAHELGDIVFVDIDTEGEELEQNARFGTVEAVKTVSDLFIPVAGTVLSVNEKLADAPDLVNKDPYGEGWMIKMKVSNAEELKSLLSAADYAKLTE